MSTRSGKRIHSSLSENVETVLATQIERKTRSKRIKEDNGEVATDKKKHFVTKPGDEIETTLGGTENTSKSVRKSRRHTLKALNISALDNEALNNIKSIRHSRRTQKEDTVKPINMLLQENNDVGKKKKKKKKKKTEVENLENEPVQTVIITKKKNIKKKKKSNSFIVEELVTGKHTEDKSFNKSNVSVDSFHSAAGSPGNYKNNNFKIEQGICKNREEGSTMTSHHSVQNVKDTRKKTKKTEKDNYFETLLNKSVQLNASNESFESSINKTETIENNDVNILEKEISGIIKTKSKQNKSKERNSLCDIENTHTKTELNHGMVFHNSIKANTHNTNMKKKSTKKNKIMNTSTSNADFTNIPQFEETVYGLEIVSPLNNSSKKRRKSTSINSTSDKIEISTTPLNKCIQEISDTSIETNIKLNEITINNTAGSERKIKSHDATNEKISLCDTNSDETFDKKNSSFNNNSNKVKQLSHNRSSRRESSIKNTTYDKSDDNLEYLDTTFNKDSSKNCNVQANSTMNKSRGSSRISFKQDIVSTVLNGTYDKISNDNSSSFCNNTYDKPKLDTTFERTKDDLDGDNLINSKQSILNADNTDNMTSDTSEECSRISITSDDSRADNIVNTTPLLIKSSMDEPQMTTASILLNKTTTPQKKEALAKITTPDKQGSPSEFDKTQLEREETFSETKTTPLKRDGTYTELRKTPSKHRSTLAENETPTPILKREGTFTKESPDLMSPKSKTVDRTPTRRKSMPSPGHTPFPSSGSGSGSRVPLNVTHSIEKPQRRSSVAAAPPRLTRVMFRSPVDDPVAITQMKGKLIKSNLKGSSKSFMFDKRESERCGSRKRSRTQGCANDGAKRARTAARDVRTHTADAEADARSAVRARTASAAARLQAPVEAEVSSKSDAKLRTKLPDFAALHRKQFMKMESLDECQRRHARRARALLTPTTRLTPTAPQTPTAPIEHIAPPTPAASLTPIAPRGALHRNKPKGTSDTAHSQAAKRLVTQNTKDIDKKNQSYTRFGFKLNQDVNPFSIPAKTSDIHPQDVIKLKRQATLPSLAGTTLRKEAARHAVMREKSFTDKRDVHRTQNRTVIKGVRTNRRFELQMMMRNID